MILPWYRKHGRDLPWRKTKDPYLIWISEVMLQQTQVSRVLHYYERFLGRFPSVKSLASTNWRSLLPYWRGLGYYQRGKNLIQTASAICERHGGEFPRSKEELKKLPGIGEYTSAAILSFAFDRCEPALDTNLKRVLARFYGCEPSEVEGKAKTAFSKKPRSSALLNHALMDIGATLCRSRKVDCPLCPLASECAFARNPTLPLPAKGKEKQSPSRVAVHVGAACIHKEGKYLLAQVKSGEWEFPGGKREPGEDIRACLKREIREELGVEIAVRPAFLSVDFEKGGKKHRLHFCRSQILKGIPKCLEHKKLAWVAPEDFSRYTLRETNQAALKKLRRER